MRKIFISIIIMFLFCKNLHAYYVVDKFAHVIVTSASTALLANALPEDKNICGMRSDRFAAAAVFSAFLLKEILYDDHIDGLDIFWNGVGVFIGKEIEF